jgi:hypothetical protein
MYNAGKILTGLVLFVALVTLPFWYGAAHGKLNEQPKLEKPAKATRCIEDTAYMRAWHMDMLNQWRNAVVRDNERIYTASDGKQYKMSLTGTCLQCHADKAKFCDQCHSYVGVQPYCWECHVTPQEKPK